MAAYPQFVNDGTAPYWVVHGEVGGAVKRIAIFTDELYAMNLVQQVRNIFVFGPGEPRDFPKLWWSSMKLPDGELEFWVDDTSAMRGAVSCAA